LQLDIYKSKQIKKTKGGREIKSLPLVLSEVPVFSASPVQIQADGHGEK
jgi:hypothetical protein